MNRVEFETEVPQQLTLKQEPVSIGKELVYLLSDGRQLYLTWEQSASIRQMQVEPGEPFWLCVRRGGHFDLWLDPTVEKSRARREAPELEKQLRDSLDAAEPRKRDLKPYKPSLEIPATSGLRSITARTGKATPSKTGGSRQVLLGRIIRAVTEELATAGERWDSGSVQDLVTTCYIAAAKDGFAGWDGEAGVQDAA
jgi:hypothetical protein